MAVDEATRAFLLSLSESGVPPITEQTLEQARLAGRLRRTGVEGPELWQVRDQVAVAPGATGVPVRVLLPRPSPRAVVVYYHGGGWVLGSVDEFDALGRVLAKRLGAAVVLVEYRLAPEHRFPAAVEDAWTALTWAAARAGELAGAGAPLVVMGDSAGGNLAAVVARRARDAGGPQVDLQVLVYPVTDADLDGPGYTEPGNQLLLTRAAMGWFWDHYAPRRTDRLGPDAAPLRAADLAGLPPAEVLLAEHDVLRDEGEAYAARLAAAGVPVQVRRFPGQMHGFFALLDVLPGCEAAVDYVAERFERFLSRHQVRATTEP